MGDVKITISPDGAKVDVSADGFTGGACEDFMTPIMNAIGDIDKKERKPEFFTVGGSSVKTGA